MNYKVFDDFILEESVSQDIIYKYKEKIPSELLQAWQQYGFGSVLNGYLKFINPDEFVDIMNESYFRSDGVIPIFATGMGDIIIWEEDKYLSLLNFRRGRKSCISARFKFFFSNLQEEEFINTALDWFPYTEAVDRYGVPRFNECFGYVPLIGAGGSEKVDNLDKVKLIEHIYIITQFMGPIK